MDPRFPKLRSQAELDAMLAAQTRSPVLSVRPILRFVDALVQGLPGRRPRSRRP